jgi:hypothetical protein
LIQAIYGQKLQKISITGFLEPPFTKNIAGNSSYGLKYKAINAKFKFNAIIIRIRQINNRGSLKN